MDSVSSSDEGEIRDSSVEKATTSLPLSDGTSVDRQDRIQNSKSLSRSPVPDRRSRDGRSRDRSRSPYSARSPRGFKRARDDDNDRHRRDNRRFKVHYETHSSEYGRRSRNAYDDYDDNYSNVSDLRYDDHSRYDEKRARTRSRSPYRANRDDRYGRNGQSYRNGGRHGDYDSSRPNRPQSYADVKGRDTKDQSVLNRGQSPLPADNAKYQAKSTQGSSHSSKLSHDLKLTKIGDGIGGPNADPEPEPIDEATMIEQRRKRREAIKAKYRGSATPMLIQALQLGDKSGPSSPKIPEGSASGRSTSPAVSTPSTPLEIETGSPTVFAITNDQDLANINGQVLANDEDDGPSAADYDPTLDMKEDNLRESHNDKEVPSRNYDETLLTTEQDVLLPIAAEQPSQTAKDDFDMFADNDDDDMFAVESATNSKPHDHSDRPAVAVPIPQAKLLDVKMLDNWDDVEGYYKIILGELLDGRYHVQSSLGKGMFSGVVRALDTTTKELVAIKLIRNNETMRKAGLKEIEILQKINSADPEDKKHLIRLVRSFEHKGHLCMVFENLNINLREVLKKFGRDIGINLRAVRVYAQQMFLALSLLKKCNILHADLKPDNILINESRSSLKICDLGSASDASDNDITPYLVSRFYRAPEIILGMPYDFSIDIWSIGCTLYELYTGKILFTGRTNNQMLKSIMDCRGKITTKMLKRAQFAHVHFDELANFRSVEQDKLTGKDTVKTINFARPARDLRTRLTSASKGLTDPDTKELALFADLLDRCLALNPEKRCTPTEALKHPFIMKIVAAPK